MSFTPEDKLSRILPVVISGGRRTLKQRPTARLLPDLHGITADPVWAVMDEDAADYEPDGHEIAAYPRAWAEEYAAAHWTALKPPEPGGFLGAFAGREYACRLAEERGYWAVLQLDDNIRSISCFRHRAAGVRVAANHGGMGMYADILAALVLSTNGRMVGAFLGSVSPNRWSLKVSRPGFPYSLFVEQVGPGRENWFGPFEDDIIHAYQYGSSASPATALVVPTLIYTKETESKTGMRAKYNHERAVPLQRLFPESAKVSVHKSHSNGRGGPRVFHTMANNAIRTPMIITDQERYQRIAAYLMTLGREFTDLYRQDVRAKVSKRAARYSEPPSAGASSVS